MNKFVAGIVLHHYFDSDNLFIQDSHDKRFIKVEAILSLEEDYCSVRVTVNQETVVKLVDYNSFFFIKNTHCFIKIELDDEE